MVCGGLVPLRISVLPRIKVRKLGNMRSFKRIAAGSLTATALVLTAGLAGCSSTEEAQSESQSQSGSGEVVTLNVGASPSPHAEILQYIADNLAAENGIELNIVEFTDYVQPNEALEAGELDANYFQTVPYLETQEEERGYDFESGEGVHLEPVGIYSETIADLADLPDDAQIGVISDTSNQERALTLLAEQGLVTLPESGDINVATVTPANNYELVEVEGPNLVRTLADVDIAVINGNYALSGGLQPSTDALALESAEDNPAVNILAWKADSEKLDAIQTLEGLLHSDEVREFISSTWTDGSVIPAF